MNKCYLLGQVCNEPLFEFLYDSYNISISSFTLKIVDNNFLQIIGYDDIADYVYRNVHSDENLLIEGHLHSINNNLLIEIVSIEKVLKK